MRVHALANPHTHWREQGQIQHFLPYGLLGGARLFGFMPNTKDGLTSAEDIMAYKQEAESIAARVANRGETVDIIPIGMITEATTPEDINRWHVAGIRDGKVYPKDRTTKSHNGVEQYNRLLPAVKRAGELGIRIHFHPEHPDLMIDNRDAEFQFITMIRMFLAETEAIIIWEHATDARLIPFWKKWAETGRFFVTVTAHHLLEDENTTLGYAAAICKPTYKTGLDRYLLNGFVREDNPWVMAIGDDAPHPADDKHRAGPCACGAYTAPFLLPLFAHALDDLLQHDAGKKVFENFTSNNARRLYGITTEPVTVNLVRGAYKIPPIYTAGSWDVEPFWAGRKLLYNIAPHN